MSKYFHTTEEPVNLASFEFDDTESGLQMGFLLRFVDPDIEEVFLTMRNSHHRGVLIGGLFAGLLGVLFPAVEVEYQTHWNGLVLFTLGICMLVGVVIALICFSKVANRSATSRARAHEGLVLVMLTMLILAIAAVSGYSKEICENRLEGKDRQFIQAQCFSQIEPYFFLPYLLFIAARLPRLLFLIAPSLAGLGVLYLSSASYPGNGEVDQWALKTVLSGVFVAGILVISAVSEYLERCSFAGMVRLEEKIRMTQDRQKTLDVVVTSVIPRHALAQQHTGHLDGTALITGSIVVVEKHCDAGDNMSSPEALEALEGFFSKCSALADRLGMRRIRLFQTELWFVSDNTDVEKAAHFSRAAKHATRDSTRVRIGIHWGTCVSVSTGVTYDVQGPMAASALRTKQYAAWGEVCLTPSVFELLSPWQRATCRGHQQHPVYLLNDGPMSDLPSAPMIQLSQRTLYRGLMHLLGRFDERDAVAVMNQSIQSIEDWLGAVSGPRHSSPLEISPGASQHRNSVQQGSSNSGAGVSSGFSLSVSQSANSDGAGNSVQTPDDEVESDEGARDGLAVVARIERRLVKEEGKGCCSWTWGLVGFSNPRTKVRFNAYFTGRIRMMVFAARMLLASYVMVGVLAMGIEECWSPVPVMQITSPFLVTISLIPLLVASCTSNRWAHRAADVLLLVAFGIVHLLHQLETGTCVTWASTTTLWMLSLLHVSVVFADLDFGPLTAIVVVVYVYYAALYLVTQSPWPTTPLMVAIVALCLLIWQGSVVESVAEEFGAHYQSESILAFLRREASRLERVVSHSVPRWAMGDLSSSLEKGSLSGPPLMTGEAHGIAVAVRVPSSSLERPGISPAASDTSSFIVPFPDERSITVATAIQQSADDVAALVVEARSLVDLHIVSRQGDRLVIAGKAPVGDVAVAAVADLIASVSSFATAIVHVGPLNVVVFRAERLSVSSFGAAPVEALAGLEACPSAQQIGCFVTEEAAAVFCGKSTQSPDGSSYNVSDSRVPVSKDGQQFKSSSGLLFCAWRPHESFDTNVTTSGREGPLITLEE